MVKEKRRKGDEWKWRKMETVGNEGRESRVLPVNENSVLG